VSGGGVGVEKVILNFVAIINKCERAQKATKLATTFSSKVYWLGY
jgi:hypothetical protein